MIVEIGHYALVLALCFAIVQGTVPFWGAARQDPALMSMAPAAALGQFLFVSMAFLALIYAHVTSDFSVLNVVENSSTMKPLIYKISGVWGNHEGSLVLWVWILCLFGAAVAARGHNLPDSFKARVLAIQGLIGVAFLAFILFTSNPFARLTPAPFEGNGLNPILQDPGLAIHPPMLYLGYVGFSMAYSFAMAALIEGRVDPAWARWLRPWTLAAWTALTLGIALGSWWAYYELGWGGFWFWDPVENASFMPWLAGTALLHSAIVVEKRDALKSWTILLAILTFSLSLLGTFLVRSGVLTSVHAFATDPSRGLFILLILIVAIGGSLALYAWRAPTMEGGGMFAPISRESGLVLNNLLLAAATATVLLGTLYPLILETTTGAKISVGGPYFQATFIPLMVPLIAAVPIGAMLAWKRADLPGVLARLKLAAAASLLVLLGVWAVRDGSSVMGLLGFLMAAWLVLGSLTELGQRIGLGTLPPGRVLGRLRGLPRSAFAMVIAHAGLGVLIAGMTAVSTGQTQRILTMSAGQTVDLAGYQVRFDGVEDVAGANYRAQRGQFTLLSASRVVATINSEKRTYLVERMPTTEAGIRTTLLGDTYLVLGDALSAGRWNVRMYYNPLAVWMWLGAGIMGVGGLVSLSDRRLRVGAPQPAAKPSTAAPARA
ncbi:cytochrome c-type biogenesis protein CcmF [Arboricoccus pini]|uniref:Cytochrome c-type biogenesis protein CcmF n=1 Tax=Arboricoccus pini TaxID=1963835 RepID=A0A212PYG2_9PROT|nr:heme lyase CcmF/NrfE family subunit [Arboricoccus pini]SNB52004.1 cytochrome c-type biogenesis protein CcmF [Arboricoccus pini]